MSETTNRSNRTNELGRRAFVARSAGAIAAASLGGSLLADGAPTPARYRVGVCDWMMLKRQTLGAFPLAKEVGADGVEVDMGSLGERETFESKLATDEGRKAFVDAARENGVSICSLAMSGFYAQSFAERPTYMRMAQDAIDAAKWMGVKVLFLPLGVRGDLVKRPELRPAVVDRLREVGDAAERSDVTVGIETALDSQGERRLLEDIGSSAVRVYFNFANPLQGGRDLFTELRTLGADSICQIHATDEDGVWLQDNKRLDMHKAKSTLDEIGWGGWLVVERSRDARDGRNVRKNFSANAAYLKRVFQNG